MRKQNAVQKFLILLAFVFFPIAGYLTVGSVTSCQAADCYCDATCVDANSLSAAIRAVYRTIINPAIDEAQAQLIAYFTPLTQDFLAGILPIIDWTTREFVSWFDTFWYYNLLPSMQTMTDELTTANAEQSYALGSFKDAENIIRVKKTFEDMGLTDHRELRPGGNVCVAGTVMGSMTRAAVFGRAYNTAAAAERLPRTANAATSLDSAGNTINNPSAAGLAADMKDRWKTFTTRYCRKDYNNANTNPDNAGASGCTADQPFADQDVDVTGMIFMKDTINLKDKDTKQSIDDLVTNIAEPFVKKPVVPNAGTTTDGQSALLDTQSYKTKRQLIYDDLYHIVARRAPGGGPTGDLTPLLAAMRQETGEELSTAPNPSRNEVMRAMITQRFRSGKYALRQIDEPENNRREMVIQQALQLMQMNDQMDLMDRYALLLAAQVSAEVRASKPLTTAAEGASKK